MALVETELDPSLNLITQTVTGNLILHDFIKAFHTAMSHPDFKTGMNVLWDLTDASLVLTETMDLHQMIKFIQFNQDKRGENFKLAMVVNSKLDYGISKMYEAFGEKLPFSKKVFYDIREAKNWLTD